MTPKEFAEQLEKRGFIFDYQAEDDRCFFNYSHSQKPITISLELDLGLDLVVLKEVGVYLGQYSSLCKNFYEDSLNEALPYIDKILEEGFIESQPKSGTITIYFDYKNTEDLPTAIEDLTNSVKNHFGDFQIICYQLKGQKAFKYGTYNK